MEDCCGSPTVPCPCRKCQESLIGNVVERAKKPGPKKHRNPTGQEAPCEEAKNCLQKNDTSKPKGGKSFKQVQCVCKACLKIGRPKKRGKSKVDIGVDCWRISSHGSDKKLKKKKASPKNQTKKEKPVGCVIENQPEEEKCEVDDCPEQEEEDEGDEDCEVDDCSEQEDEDCELSDSPEEFQPNEEDCTMKNRKDKGDCNLKQHLVRDLIEPQIQDLQCLRKDRVEKRCRETRSDRNRRKSPCAMQIDEDENDDDDDSMKCFAPSEPPMRKKPPKGCVAQVEKKKKPKKKKQAKGCKLEAAKKKTPDGCVIEAATKKKKKKSKSPDGCVIQGAKNARKKPKTQECRLKPKKKSKKQNNGCIVKQLKDKQKSKPKKRNVQCALKPKKKKAKKPKKCCKCTM